VNGTPSGSGSEPDDDVALEAALGDATAFLRRLGAAGSPATVVVASLAGGESDSAPPDGRLEEVLRQRLEPLIRSTDLLRRVGPGEFLLVVPAGADAAGTPIVDRVRGVAALPVDDGAESWSLALRVGVSSFDADREEPAVVVAAARAEARGAH